MKRLSIAFVLLTFGMKVNSQNIFLPGYIVNKQGDTIKGEVRINNKNEIELYNKVFLKEPRQTVPKQYAPIAIKGYGYEDKNFESVKIAGQYKFLKIICRGTIMFYEYKNSSSNDQYMAGDSRYFMVKNHEDFIVEVFYDNHMKKELKSHLHEDSSCVYQIEHSRKLNLEQVTQLFNTYNANHKTIDNKLIH